jgi:hypothetical protein
MTAAAAPESPRPAPMEFPRREAVRVLLMMRVSIIASSFYNMYGLK